MPDPRLKPQLKPRFWIMRRADGTRSVEVAKFTHHDPKMGHFGSTVIEATMEFSLSEDMADLYEGLAALDAGLGARTSPHLRDLIGALILQAYEAGTRYKEKK
jgi:hypothetical protein